MSPSSSAFEHRPVLLSEVVNALAPRAGTPEEAALFVDATYGRGGHARALLACLGPLDRLVVLDRDPAAVLHAHTWARSEPRVLVLKGRFGNIRNLMEAAGLGPVDALLVDLGVSSAQLDDASRGFSFRFSGPLDMRMDNSSGETLAAWLDHVDQADLSQILIELGDLPARSARRISEAIAVTRKTMPITTTDELAALVRPLVGRQRRRSQLKRDAATGVFQALRMHINQEVEELRAVLDQGFELLREQGRMAVISFHSIEDRIVKLKFKHLLMGDPRLAKLPIRGRQSQARSILRRAAPRIEEMKANPRARSAKLRVIEKQTMEMAA